MTEVMNRTVWLILQLDGRGYNLLVTKIQKLAFCSREISLGSVDIILFRSISIWCALCLIDRDNVPDEAVDTFDGLDAADVRVDFLEAIEPRGVAIGFGTISFGTGGGGVSSTMSIKLLSESKSKSS